MGQLGDMFPGRKVDENKTDEAGDGQLFQPGPLDLEGGVIRIRRRPAADQDSESTVD